MKIVENGELTQGEQAYRHLRRMIVDCELPPGSSVSEPELTQLLDMGKAAVRAALLRLSHDGLVSAVPRYGYRVAPLDIKDALELTQLRLLTEPPAYRLATGRLDPAVIELARKRYSAGYDRNNAKSVTRYLTQSREFKLAVARASGNGRLATWVEEVSERIDRYLRVSALTSDLSPTIASNLLPLCDAMLDGQADQAESLARENIQAVTARLLSALFRPHEKSTEFAFSGEDVASMLGLRPRTAELGKAEPTRRTRPTRNATSRG
nr:GntR family transcriptional regulator [Ramlibacter algicola]